MQGLGTTATQLTNRWELQGKERDLTFGLNRINFGARVYNPTIGVWDQVDPLADERVWVSPYNFNQNNPINRIDPTGALDEPCCGDPGGMLLTEAKSQWDAAKSYGRGLLQRVEGGLATILSYTDVNDATVLVTTVTRRGNAINIDGSKATTADKWAAAGGAILPGISGSAAKRVVGGVVDKIDDAIDASKDFNQARNKAVKWLDEKGFKATEPNIGGVKATEGKAVGMKGKNADGKNSGFRVEYDKKNGAHINVFSGKEKGPHFTFPASEKTVNKIQKKYEKN